MKNTSTIPITLVSQYPLIGAGICSIIEAEKNLLLVGKISDLHEIKRTQDPIKPGVVILNFNRIDSITTEIIEYLCYQYVQIKIVLLTANENLPIKALVSAGVGGFVLDTEEIDSLIKAIFAVANNNTWFSQKIVDKLIQAEMIDSSVPKTFTLTNREREILAKVAQGWNNARIAIELNLARQTVNNYLSRIYSKILVDSRAEAIVWARERQIQLK